MTAPRVWTQVIDEEGDLIPEHSRGCVDGFERITVVPKEALDAALKEVKEYAEGVVKLTKSLGYIAGIVEVGEKRKLDPKEFVDIAVLNYVKSLEQKLAALIERIEPNEPTVESALGEIDYLHDLEQMVGKSAIEASDLRQKLTRAVEALKRVRDTPGLGGLDFKSDKKWRESSMKVIDHITRTALKEIEGDG